MLGRILKFAGWTLMAFLALFCSVSLVASARIFGEPPRGMKRDYNTGIETIQISNNLYMLRGAVSNVIVLITDEGVLIVDSGVARMVEKLDAAIARLTDKKVRYVINTHSHHDHREGNGYFRAKGADVMAQENTKRVIALAVGNPNVTALDVPTVTYDDEYTLLFGGEEIRLYHVPLGHTDGDTLIHFANHNLVATGDVFVYRGLPFISLGAGATVDSMLQGQTQILDLVDEETTIAPGHGPLTNKAGLSDTHQKLKDIRNRIARLKEKGVSARMSRFYFPTRDTWRPWREEETGMDDRYYIFLVHSSLPGKASNNKENVEADND